MKRALQSLLLFGLLATAVAQIAGAPALPVVDEDVCPGEGCVLGTWTAKTAIDLYDTWKPNRHITGKLERDDHVTALRGVHITLLPDVIEMTEAMPSVNLKVGDKIFRYMVRGEGTADLFYNGEMHREMDGSFIKELDGTGCQRDCFAKVTRNGRKQWWVEVKDKLGNKTWTFESKKFSGSNSNTE